MTIRDVFQKIGANEDLNFLLTNRIPRAALTRFIGWFSQIRHPWVRDASIAVWRSFADLDLSEARKTHFDSLHDCFIRELKPAARAVDMSPDVFTSPCDGIVGAMGRVQDGQVFQAKGFPYTLKDLLGEQASAGHWHNGWFMTIRITSSMYHRFHAPYQGKLKRVQYFSGDTWNVNPIALKRVEKLFSKNERALLETEIGPQAYPVALVPVATLKTMAVLDPWSLISPQLSDVNLFWAPPLELMVSGAPAANALLRMAFSPSIAMVPPPLLSKFTIKPAKFGVLDIPAW